MIRIFPLILVAASMDMSVLMARAEAPKDNVVILSAVEEYRFADTKSGPEVKNSITTEYLATRRAEDIQPHVFHNNVVLLDKASGGKPQYRNVNSPTVFHDDSKVCFFNLRLEAKDKKAKVNFKRTFSDAAHFTGVYLQDDYPVREKKVVFHIPSSFPDIRLIDRNFPAEGVVRDERTGADGSRVITYTITSLPEIPDDVNRPSALSALPQILVQGYFPDTDSLYRYHRPMLDVDTVIPGVAELLVGILDGETDEAKKIERIYRYVQQSVRYVAFEAGESAYRPDTPAEVIRKRYGDCKGMALLLATLLNRAGVEACIAAVGTRDIPFGISAYPSLAATNHMICIVGHGGETRYLDPTQEQISAGHIPWWIRGKDAMLFKPGGYEMVQIPVVSPLESADRMHYSYVLTADGLAGVAERVCTEDMAERFANRYSDVPGQHLNELLAKSLLPTHNAAVQVDSLVYDTSIPGQVTIEAPILNRAAVVDGGDALYLDLNTGAHPFATRIDMADRRSDYKLPVEGVTERSCVVLLPGGCRVELPDDFSVSTPQGVFTCRFSRQGDTVSMTKRAEIASTHLPLGEIAGWNKALAAWNEACNRQIEIHLP